VKVYYSYSDYTTKGHGVIEGGGKDGRRYKGANKRYKRIKQMADKKSNEKYNPGVNAIYTHLKHIQDKAKFKRSKSKI
jgi:hypothetical protein